jgi:predicted nucleotidyltransferase
MSISARQEVIDEMAALIVREIRPQRIVLFGSRARGDALTLDSDYDLLIIAASSEPRWLRTVPIYRLLAGIGVPKDVLWWTPEEVAEWRNVRSHFINVALREGAVIYEAPA